MSDDLILGVIRSGLVPPPNGADFSAAGFLLRLKFRETTEEELSSLLEALRGTPAVSGGVSDLIVARHIFVLSTLLLTWREAYRSDPARYRLIGDCLGESGRIMRERDILD